jgi:hypothetical protein
MATDDFNRADAALSAPWTKQNAAGMTLGVVSNQLTPIAGSGLDTYYFYSGAATGGDQFSEFKLAQKSANNDWGPACRCSTGPGSGNGYFYECFSSGRTLGKHVSGGFTALVTAGVDNSSVGDILHIEVTGTNIVSKRNGVTDLTFSDPSLTTGQPGVFWMDR